MVIKVLKGLRMALADTREYLQSAIEFLKPYLPLANSHMVHYFTHNFYETILDEGIRNSLEGISSPVDVPKFLLEQKQCEDVVLVGFLKAVRKNSFLTSSKVFEVNSLNLEFKGNIGMSDKKSHEVMEFCDFLVDKWHQEHLTVFDVGSGKGHLAQTLSLVSGWNVVGLDVMNVKEEMAEKRSKRLKGVLKQVMSNESGSFTQYSCYITERTRLRDYCKNDFDQSEVGIIGLHTCGNLASVSLKLFANEPISKYLCSVGCCYHLLEEQFSENPFRTGPIVPQDRERNPENSFDCGFPLSQFLQSKQFSLGRNARMMASQSVHRLALEDCPDTMFFRAVLEVLLSEKSGLQTSEEDPQSHFTVGRVKHVSNFSDYVMKATKKLQNFTITEQDCDSYLARYLPEKNRLLKYYYLRNSLAPVVETVILLDRLLFLQEHGVREASLVRLFDPVTSPRCYAVVAQK